MRVRADHKVSLGELLWVMGLFCTSILLVVTHTCICLSKVAELHTKNAEFYCMEIIPLYIYIHEITDVDGVATEKWHAVLIRDLGFASSRPGLGSPGRHMEKIGTTLKCMVDFPSIL